MTQNFKRTLMTLVLALGLIVAPLALIGSVSAQGSLQDPGRGIGEGLGSGATATDPDAAAGRDAGEQLDSMVQLAINIFSLVVGIISVIMIIIGGLKYITSGGDSGNVTSAKNTILYAIIGLVIVALAQIIVRYVLGQVGGN